MVKVKKGKELTSQNSCRHGLFDARCSAYLHSYGFEPAVEACTRCYGR